MTSRTPAFDHVLIVMFGNQYPVSYRKADAQTTSNGYGTLAEAGWTPQEPLGGVTLGGALAAGATVDAAVVLFQPEAGGPVRMVTGRYATI